MNNIINEFEQTLIKTLETIKSRNIPHGIEISTNEKIVVFGDIHGDIDTLTKAYSLAQSQGVKYFIFCGDYIDKGKDSIGCFKFVLDHFNENPDHFIPLMGNHETLMFGDVLLNVTESKPEIMPLLLDVICLMPIGALINITGNKKIFCAHGGYPRLYKTKYIHIRDSYDDVWNLFAQNKNKNIPEDANEMIYEDNTTFNISPIEYINKIYSDYVSIVSLIHESPYNIKAYSNVVDILNRLKQENSNEQKQYIISSALKHESIKMYLKNFALIVNTYKAQLARIERAKQNMILLKDYIQESDLYVLKIKIGDSIDSYEKRVQFVKDNGTNFFYHRRGEVDRYGLCYPVEQLKDWMNKNNINALIRGHEHTINCATSIDLNTNEENMNPTNIQFNDSSKLYITLHTTSSYAKLHESFKVGKFAIVDGGNENIEIVSVNLE